MFKTDLLSGLSINFIGCGYGSHLSGMLLYFIGATTMSTVIGRLDGVAGSKQA